MGGFPRSIFVVAIFVGWGTWHVDGQAAAINDVGTNCGSTPYLKDGMNDCIIDAPILKDAANQYTFRLPPGKPDFSVLITLRTLDGVATMNILTPDESVFTDNTVYNAHLNAVGESYIRLPADTLRPGQYTISVGATQALKASIPMYLRVQTFNSEVRLAAKEKKALGQIAKTCCKPAGMSSDPTICDTTIPGALSKDATKDMCQVDNNICNSEGHLTKLSLGSADFDCPNFPKEFAVFEHLDTLDVAFNSFGEDTVENVAKVLSGAKDLQRLVIRYANLTGTIACELFTDHKLKTIMLSFNGITGSLPACVLESPHLEELYMSRLNLTGTIPDSIPPGSNLRLWYALNTVEETMQQYDGGAFSGSLPSTLSNAAGMRYLELSFHDLEGPIPALPEALMVFDVSENSLTGTIPTLPKGLLMFDAANNKLTGPFPDVAGLADLGVFDISNSNMGTELPRSFGAAAQSLNYFDAKNSGIKGYLEATQWGDCESLSFLSLGGNELQGSIPASLGSIVELSNLDLHGNSLGGDLSEFAAAIPKGKAPRRRNLLSGASLPSGSSSGCHRSSAHMVEPQQQKGVEGVSGANAFEQLLWKKWAAREQLAHQRSLLQTGAAAPAESADNFDGTAHTAAVPAPTVGAVVAPPQKGSLTAAAHQAAAAPAPTTAAPSNTVAAAPAATTHTAAAPTTAAAPAASRAAPAHTPTIAVDPAVPTTTSDTPVTTSGDTAVTSTLPPDTPISDTPTPASSPDSTAAAPDSFGTIGHSSAPDTADPQSVSAGAFPPNYDEETTTRENMGNVLMYLDLSANQLTGSLPDELANAQLFVDPSNYDTITRIRMSLATRVFDVSENKLHGEVPAWLLEAIPVVQLNCGCSTYNNYTDNSFYCPTKSTMQSTDLDENQKIQLATNNLTCLLPGKEESPVLLTSYIKKPASWITSIPAPPEPVDVSSGEDAEAALQSTARSSSAGASGSSSSSSSLLPGAIAGIVVGIVGGLAVLIGLAFFGYKHVVQPKRATSFHKADIPDDMPLHTGPPSHHLPMGPAQV